MDGSYQVYGRKGPSPRVLVPGRDVSTWPDQKFARALAHLDDVRAIERQWNAAANAWLDLKLDEAKSTVEAYVRLESRLPTAELSLAFGDALHCIRGALDALVWELAWLDGKPPKSAVQQRIQFPFCKSEKSWNAACSSTLATVDPVFLDRMKQYQPLGDQHSDSALHWIFELNNQDKHRGAIEAIPHGFQMAVGFSRVSDIGHPDTGKGGVKFTPNLPFDISNGAHFGTFLYGFQLELTSDSSPLPIAFAVRDREGRTAPLDHLVDRLPAIGGLLAHLRDGEPREPAPPAADDKPPDPKT